MPASVDAVLPSTRARRAGEAVLIFVVGFGVTALIGLGLGVLAMSTEAAFDARAYAWLVPMKSHGSSYTAMMEFLTGFGDPVACIWQAVLLTIIFMLASGRRWWLPGAVLLLGVALELVLQRGIGAILQREPPPGALGTYFSGGSARIVILYGLSLFLIVTRWPRISMAWRAIGLIAVAFLALGMGYSRLYLLIHWPSDVPAGWLMGTLIAISIILATRRVIAEPAPAATVPVAILDRSGTRPRRRRLSLRGPRTRHRMHRPIGNGARSRAFSVRSANR